MVGWTNIYTFSVTTTPDRVSGVISLSHHEKKFPESSGLRAIEKDCVSPELRLLLGIFDSQIER